RLAFRRQRRPGPIERLENFIVCARAADAVVLPCERNIARAGAARGVRFRHDRRLVQPAGGRHGRSRLIPERMEHARRCLPLPLCGAQRVGTTSRREQKIYNKLFLANNLPAVTPPGEHYGPEWMQEEIEAMARVYRLGLAELRASIHCID